MLNRPYEKHSAIVTYSFAPKSRFRWSAGLLRSRFSRGQAMAEFALILPFALVVMLVGVQFAVIGQAALALSQGSSALARYAAMNPGAMGDATGNGTVTLSSNAAARQLLSSSICPDSTCSNLTVTITSYSGSSTTQTATKPQQTDRLVISLSYNAASKLVLPNPFMAVPPFFPGVKFPTALAASDSQMYE